MCELSLLAVSPSVYIQLALGFPFAALLLSIAVMPVAFPHAWHNHHGKVVIFWSVLGLTGLLGVEGIETTIVHVAHTMLDEYFPFLILISTLYIVSGGVLIKGHLHGSPLWNTSILALGSLLASFVGTVGASMILIRPLINANIDRPRNIHVVIFFIFMVSNIGGSLSPLGDPPLFLGFLEGVSFFWTTTHLFSHTMIMLSALLFAFYLLDKTIYKVDSKIHCAIDKTTHHENIGIEGKVNFIFLTIAVTSVLISGLWEPGVSYKVLGAELALQDILRDASLITVSLASLTMTKRDIRDRNHFTFAPIKEVGKLFAGIFVTMIPIIHQLQEGSEGIFAPLIALTTDAQGKPIDAAFFWLTGLLSSFLDNAPTYLVFFNLASGDPILLQGELASTLTAISAGAVFMGANTYIGNAPNLMVKAIAEERGIRMPSFLGYMLWSFSILTPLFVILTVVFF